MRAIDDEDPNRVNIVTKENFTECLGQDDHYWAFLKFFESQIALCSRTEVLKKYLFASNAQAQDMLYRLYEGVCNLIASQVPLIHPRGDLKLTLWVLLTQRRGAASIDPSWFWCGI